jgi:putative flippase GtrA
MKRRQEFLTFAAVGVAGFLVDAGTVTALVHVAGSNRYLARLASFLVAASVTWLLNRQFTFHGATRSEPIQQWLRFLGANALGGLTNLGIYSWLVWTVPIAHDNLVIAVAAGALAAFGINFMLSRTLVFKAA